MQGWRGGPGRAAPARHPPLPRTVLRKEGSDIGGGCGEQDGRSRHSGGLEPQEVDGGESAGEVRARAWVDREGRARADRRAWEWRRGARWPQRRLTATLAAHTRATAGRSDRWLFFFISAIVFTNIPLNFLKKNHSCSPQHYMSLLTKYQFSIAYLLLWGYII